MCVYTYIYIYTNSTYYGRRLFNCSATFGNTYKNNKVVLTYIYIYIYICTYISPPGAAEGSPREASHTLCIYICICI